MKNKKINNQISLGNCIRKRRKQLGWSQEVFATQTGLHRTYVGSIERGERNISLENLCVISNRFGLKISELMKEASL
jgi:transcriptional regulator with XRE-family HTH domain